MKAPGIAVDFVVCDAALHHAQNLKKVLLEIVRVLKPGGFLLAIREPVLPNLEPIRTFKKLTFGFKERRRGDIENIYSVEEWETAFSISGMTLEIYEYFLKTSSKERTISLLKRWNGLIFARYFFVAKKPNN